MKTWLAIIVLSATLLAPTTAHATTEIAHRGTAYRPENTLAGIRSAAYHGAEWVEVDVRETADGYLRLMHDATLDRTTTCTGQITELARDDLRDCRTVERWPWYRRRSASFDGRYRIPGLAAAFRRADDVGIGVIIDLKVDDISDRLARVINDSPAPVIVIADTPEQVDGLRANTNAPVWWGGPWPDSETFAHVDAVTTRWSDVTRSRVGDAHAHGVDVVAWTFRAQNVWLPKRYRSDGSRRARGDVNGWVAEIVALGVDGVMVDEPNLVELP